MEMDFKITEPGQKKTINGFECREIVAVVTVREKDKKAEDGAMTITSSMWLTPKIAAVKELEEFDLKVAKALYLPMAQEMAAQITPAMGMYPGLGEAIGKLETEKVNMDGTAIMTVIRGDIVGNPEQQKAAAKQAEQPKQGGIPTSLGGLLGGLGRKAAPKKEEPADGKLPSFMTSTTELMNVSTVVSDAEVAIPAGFKEKK
jgi:hypothetical protein